MPLRMENIILFICLVILFKFFDWGLCENGNPHSINVYFGHFFLFLTMSTFDYLWRICPPWHIWNAVIKLVSISYFKISGQNLVYWNSCRHRTTSSLMVVILKAPSRLIIHGLLSEMTLIVICDMNQWDKWAVYLSHCFDDLIYYTLPQIWNHPVPWFFVK